MNKNDFMNKFSDFHEGMNVCTQDGENLGKIVSLDSDSFTVEKGFFFPKDFTARYDDILRCDGDELILNRQAVDLKDWKDSKFSGWDEVDAHNSSQATGVNTPGIFGIGATGNLMDSPKTDVNTGFNQIKSNRTEQFENTGDVRIQGLEENPEADKIMRQTGKQQVCKRVHTEHKTITVPVLNEEVIVERTSIGGGDATLGAANQEEARVRNEIQVDRPKHKTA